MMKKLILIFALLFSFNHLLIAEFITAKEKYAKVDSLAKSIRDDIDILVIESDSLTNNGLSKFWKYQYSILDTFYFFHACSDSVIFDSVAVWPGFMGSSRFSMDWIDSDSALALAYRQGGKEFSQLYPDYTIEASLGQSCVPYSYPTWHIKYYVENAYKFIVVNASLPNVFPPPRNFQLKHSYELMNIFKLDWETPDTTTTNAKLVGYLFFRNFEACDTLAPDSTSYKEIQPPCLSDFNVYYHLQAIYEKPDGVSVSTDTLFHRGDAISIDIDEDMLHIFYLGDNYPNPFNPVTMINYQLPIISEVELAIYDISGKKISTLVSGKQQAGNYTVSWDASEFASGIYLYRLSIGDIIMQKKCAFLK